MQSPHSLRILVAEDNLINQTLFTKMLSVVGYTAEVVDDGNCALDLCKQQAYDLIFMDYQMPGADGIETAKNIKAINRHPKPVIVLMTANLLVNNDYLSHPGVIDDFLKKPFTLQEIAAIIKKWHPAMAAQQVKKR